MKRTNWPVVVGFIFAALFGYLILRNWLKVEAHDLYIIGLVFLVALFMFISRRLARSARELRAAARRADESLAAARAAEEKYRSIFENAGEGIFQTAPDGRYLAANSALARLYGYPTPADLIHAITSIGTQIYVDPNRREEFLKEMQTKGEVADFESQVRRNDGRLLWISENAHTVRNENGEVSYFEGIVEDITERKRNEIEREQRTQRELRHQRCLLDLAQFDKSDFGAGLSVLVETIGRTLGVGRTSAWRLLEKDTEREAIVLLDLFELEKGAHVTDELVLDAANFPHYFAALRSETHIVAHDAITDPRTSEFTESYLRPLGITAVLNVPVFVKGQPAGVLGLEHVGEPRIWKDDELAFAAAVGNMIAVTFEAAERRRAEAELRAAVARADESLAAARAAEAKYRSIFENAGEGIFQTAPDGRYLAANPALARLYGYASPRDLIRAITSIGTQIYVDPSRREEFLKAMQSKGEVTDFESQVFRRDGGFAWISENAHTVRDENGAVLYFEGIVEDITERKRNEIEHEQRTQRELRHQRCLLDLAQFDKSDFGAAMSVLVETTSRTLDVARTSAWRLVEKDTAGEAIALLDLYELEKKGHVTDELMLKGASFPSYFAALRSETHIVAHDAFTDLRTSEFRETYLRPLGITAMLDVPIFVKGELAGVLCLEHVGAPRIWKDDELAFGAAVGNMIAVTFEAAERRRAEDEADRERERAEQLLLNILPITIAQRLRRGEGLIADHYTEATVLFADIVDFTRLSANITPEAVVNYLNIIFSEFDQLAQDLDLEKIKTIGDAYMVVGGVPTPRPDHIEAVVEMALAMLDACKRLSRGTKMPFTMRVGINTGPVVAGVIGIKKFIYDLWGDTVNLASRMESHGVTGEVQVTQAVYERMREKYLFEPRGKIEIKGRGEQQTYLLKGLRMVAEVLLSK